MLEDGGFCGLQVSVANEANRKTCWLSSICYANVFC